MEFDMNVGFLRMAFWQIIVIAGPILLVALAIGLFVGIIQAATSINEQTLSFVPKLVLVLLSFGLLANLMLVQLTDYFVFIFDQVTQVANWFISHLSAIFRRFFCTPSSANCYFSFVGYRCCKCC